MQTSDQRSTFAPDSATSSHGHELSRRTVLKIAGSALAIAGCGTTGSGELLIQTEPTDSDPQLGQAVARDVDESRHRRHRLAYFTGDIDPVGDTCELGCTGLLHDHEYGDTRTWH